VFSVAMNADYVPLGTTGAAERQMSICRPEHTKGFAPTALRRRNISGQALTNIESGTGTIFPAAVDDIRRLRMWPS